MRQIRMRPSSLSSPSPSPPGTNPFSPLPLSQTKMFLFRVAWDTNSNYSPPLRLRDNTDEFEYTGPERHHFDYHLSDQRHGDGKTPFASWYSQYGLAAKRCEELYRRGFIGIQLFVLWAADMTLYDAYAVAKALGYSDEGKRGDCAGDGIGACVSVHSDLAPQDTTESSGMMVSRVLNDPSRSLACHEYEYLTFSSEYVEKERLVTHLDWKGPIISIQDPWHRTIRFPAWTVRPEDMVAALAGWPDRRLIDWMTFREALSERIYLEKPGWEPSLVTDMLLNVIAEAERDLW